MPNPPVSSLLAEELAALQAFVDLLKREQKTLIDGLADDLLALIDEKSALATRLAACSVGRDAALEQLGMPAGRAGMEAWLSAAAADAGSRRAWGELLRLAAEAKALNEINGRLIGTRLHHNQQALTALMDASERAMTYGPDGHTQVTGTGRSRGSA